jgi:acyl-coenzyme A synthetase/AMP-(fatty) acid ligase
LTRLKACVTLRAGHVASPALAQELQTWCKERLQRYQYPHIVDFYGELPKTVTGKIQRFMLREPRADAVGVATAVSTAV